MAKKRKAINSPQIFLLALVIGAVGMFVFQLGPPESTTPDIPAPTDPRLVEAASQSDTEALQALLDQGIDVNSAYGDGTRALHWAVHWQDQAMTSMLLDAGADVNLSNDLGVTPLWLAAENASEDMTRRILEADADPNAMLASGETPLMMAARSGNPAVVQLLLGHSANVNAVENTQHQTALMWAAAQQHPSVVKVLLDHGADLTVRSSTWIEIAQPAGARPAIRDGLYEIVQGGFTAFLFAAQQGNIEVADLLLQAGADVDERAPNGTTALVVAVLSGNGDLAQFLLERGANPNQMDAGYSALHVAIPHQDLALVDALIENGADVNEVVISPSPARRASRDFAITEQLVGTTPFWIATQYRQASILKSLIAAGADTSFTTDNLDTALMLAIDGRPAFYEEEKRGIADPQEGQRKALELIAYTLELGIDINARNRNGDTGLHKAASRGYNMIVQYLADNGADLDVVNNRGMTPLDYAMRLRRRAIGQGATSNTTTEEILRNLGATSTN